MLKRVKRTLFISLLISLYLMALSVSVVFALPGTCKNPNGGTYCGQHSGVSDCYCDPPTCVTYGDCCDDYTSVCQSPQCKDSDGGQVFGVAGKTSNTLGKNGNDWCSGSYNLVEYYCDKNGDVQSLSYYCPKGCNDGACTGEIQQCGNGVIEQGEQCDGKDFAGTTCQSFKGYSGGSLSCNKDCTIDTGKCIKTVYCGNGICDVGEDTTSCPQDCGTSQLKENVVCYFQGATSEQKCYSDVVFNGVTTNFGCSGIGKCSATITGPKDYQVVWKSSCGGYEYTFIDGQDESIYFKCETIPPTTPCSDSDGGINYYVKGETLGPNGKGTDSCFDSIELYEYYCNEKGEVYPINYKCPNGCKDGACIQQSKQITKQDVIDWISTNCNNPITYPLGATGGVIKKPIIIP